MSNSNNIYTNCISTHNNLDYLKLVIESIEKNSQYVDQPLYIYAEGCTDGTNEWLEEQEQTDQFKYWIKPEKWDLDYWGIGGGMNFLAEKVETRFINFLHSDMWCSFEWDAPLVEKLQNEGEKTVVSSYRVEPHIFPSQRSRYGTVVVDRDKFGEFHHNFDKEKFENFADQFIQMNAPVDIPLGQGVSFMIRKEDWDRIGGNDPRFAPASYEDADLFIRMEEKGYSFHTLGRSLVYHFGARGSHFPDDQLDKGSSNRQRESESRNVRKFREKWNEPLTKDKYGQFTLPSKL